MQTIAYAQNQKESTENRWNSLEISEDSFKIKVWKWIA